jgi:hypothetical protein
MERVAVENMMRILLMASGEGQRSNEGFRSSVGDLGVAPPIDPKRAFVWKHFHVESKIELLYIVGTIVFPATSTIFSHGKFPEMMPFF